MQWTKTILAAALLAGISVGCGNEPAANQSAGEAKQAAEKVGEKTRSTNDAVATEVKNALQTLIRSCDAGDYKAAGELMIYSGDNVDMKWKEPVNYLNEEDKPYVEKTCAKLESVLHGSKELEFKEFSTEKESEGEWLIWLVSVKYEDGSSHDAYFAFLPYGPSQYGLGDID